ncbi:MAG: ABC transporter ATP-binding protein [Alphaproteobacteria bacterium]|nr:ABC transporter ATP-binding protein [Alphaproteobacteria bacterium]
MSDVTVQIASKAFGATPILQGIRFTLERGRTTALLGSSGIGKTTLLRIIAGLDPQFEGSVAVPQRIGMVFQEPRLLPWLSTVRNVEVVGTTHDRASALLDQVGLPAAASLYPRQLSLGMARRAALARALAIEPELLILDEPFASLDPTAADGLRRLVKDLSEQGNVTALLVSHDSGDVAAIADRALILYGRPARLMRDVSFDVAPEQRSAGDLAAITNQLRSILASANESGTESFNSPDVSPN